MTQTNIIKKIITLAAVVVYSFCVVYIQARPISVGALSPEQRRIIDSGARYYNEEISQQACGTSVSSSVVDSPDLDARRQAAWNFFMSKDQTLQPFQVAGILGNLMAESGVNPVRVQGAGNIESQDPNRSNGWGLMQWTPGRKITGLMQQAGITTPVYQLGSQLELVWWHFNNISPTGARNVYPGFKSTTSLEEATSYFEDRMEAAGKPAMERRYQFAREALADFGSSTAGTPAATSANGTTCPAGGGSVVGEYSLPLDRAHYDANKDTYLDAHHDYPATDIAVAEGNAVYSMTAGTVISAPNGGACGLGVTVDAGNGVIFTYCHGTDGGSVDGAREGDKVKPGQLIMHSGNTGRSTGPHLHLQIKVNGQTRCPQTLIEGIANGSPPDVASLPSSGCTY